MKVLLYISSGTYVNYYIYICRDVLSRLFLFIYKISREIRGFDSYIEHEGDGE